MNFLYAIIGIVVLTVVVSVLIHVYPKVMTSWVFWVAVALMGITFLGIPSLAVKMITRNS